MRKTMDSCLKFTYKYCENKNNLWFKDKLSFLTALHFLSFDIKISSADDFLDHNPIKNLFVLEAAEQNLKTRRPVLYLKKSKLESQDKRSWIYFIILSLCSLTVVNMHFYIP